MYRAQGPQCSDVGEALTRRLSVSSQAPYHWAPRGPFYYLVKYAKGSNEMAKRVNPDQKQSDLGLNCLCLSVQLF